jgi:hypothetical protein
MLYQSSRSRLASNDIYGAFECLTQLQLDPTNAKLNKLNDRVKPLYEKAQKRRRVAGLDQKERQRRGR